jgi:osmotically-inducible protein OsmY
MFSLFHVAVALMSAIWILAGCGNIDDQLLKKYRNLAVWDYVEDFRLVSNVKSQLAADASIDSTRIEVTSADRIVHLHGSVDSDEQKERTAEAVLKVPGVRGVANKLQVVQQP